MNLLNRAIPILSSLAILVLVEYLFREPKQIYWLVPASFLVVSLSIWRLVGRKFLNRKNWQFIITPALFLISGLIFLSFLGGQTLKHFFLAGLVILVWIFLQVIFLRFHFRPKYQAHSLENISAYLNLITIFLAASSFFSLIIFLGTSWWILIIIFAIINFLLIYQLTWSNGILFNDSWPYILVITIVLTEIFWAVSFLPTSVYVSGLLVAIGYYLTAGLARNWLLGIKEKKVVLRYLFISSISLVIVLITAKWF